MAQAAVKKRAPRKAAGGNQRAKQVVAAATNRKRRNHATMTMSHKKALAAGRAASKAVRDYLQVLEAEKPKRGRKRKKETVERQLAETKAALPATFGLKKLELAQRRIDLERELDRWTEPADHSEVRDAFIEVAAAYSKAKGISYAAWRTAGVPMADLRAAGIKTRRG